MPTIEVSCYLCRVLVTIIFCLFCLAIAVQCAYAFYFFRHIADLPGYEPQSLPLRRSVSVIICAKNEAANLQKNLPTILAQRYANDAGKSLFEVIVVNDGSTDDTAAILPLLGQQYDNFRYINLPADAPRDLKGKKYALGQGVAHAHNDWLVLIDADCVPVSGNWLAQMVAPLAHGKEIVAGYGGYKRRPGALNAFVRWETLHTFLQYSTYAVSGKPYMAVGRNMACTKYMVLKAERSELWNTVPSGDDDLLVRVGADHDNVAIVAAADAFTYTDAKTTWRDWARQKQRHLSTGKLYKDDIKMLLGFYGASHTDAWLCLFMLLFTHFWKAALLLMLVRGLIYWAIWAVTARRVNERSLIFLFPVFDIGWMIYNFAFFPYIIWKNKQQWT
jgi:glycosyltransferase involved in cell wall biosynthesis